jgi:two-component system chemotaxis response regulator CheY
MTILLVDDQRPARNILKNSLVDLKLFRGYNFLEAENYNEALELVQEYPVDLVLLDWNLGTEKTGLDILKEIRKIEKCKQVPIIMVTSEIAKSNIIEALKAGANDYVLKPIDWKVFKEKLVKILNIPQKKKFLFKLYLFIRKLI